MALEIATGSFNHGATGSKSVTGLGFTPKLVLFAATAKNGINTSGVVNSISYGASDGTNSAALGYWSSKSFGSALQSGVRFSAAACITHADPAGGILTEATFTSFDVDGFTINFTNLHTTWDCQVLWMAIGGTDVSSCTVKPFTTPGTTGAQSQSVTGIGYEPSAAWFFGSELAGALPVSEVNSPVLSQGFACAGGQFAMGVSGDDGVSPSEADRVSDGTKCIYLLDENGADKAIASFTSFDSDGFTLQWSTLTATSMHFFAVLIDGPSAAVGSFLQKTSTGAEATTGVGFTPKILQIFGIGATTEPTQAHSHFQYGVGTSSTSRAALTNRSEDNVTNANTDSYVSDTKIVILQQDTGTTLIAQADISSLDADGFTLNWTAADASARILYYVALGDGVPGSTLNRSASSELLLSDAANLEHDLSAASALSLTDEAVGSTDTAEEIQESLASVMTLSQLAVTNRAYLQTLTSLLSLTIEATHNLKFPTAASALSLSQIAQYAEDKEQDTNSVLLLDHDSVQNLKFSSASSLLALDHVVFYKLNDDVVVAASNQLDLQNTVELANFTYRRFLPVGSYDSENQFDPNGSPSAGEFLEFSHQVELHGTRSFQIGQSLGLGHSLSFQQTKNISVESLISFSDRVGRFVLGDAANHMILTLLAERRFYGSSLLNLTQLAEGAKAYFGDNTLELDHELSRLVLFSRTIEADLGLRHALTYIIEPSTLVPADPGNACRTPSSAKSRFEKIYNPFVGEVSSGITPPSTSQPTLGTNTLTLTYPYVVPTTTLVLRNPQFGNTHRFEFDRVKRESRGGTLLVFADPNWPKQQVLNVTVIGLNESQKTQLLDFFVDSLGQEIGLLDHENRQWRGFILTPDADVTHEGKNNYSVSFDFEGELA